MIRILDNALIRRPTRLLFCALLPLVACAAVSSTPTRHATAMTVPAPTVSSPTTTQLRQDGLQVDVRFELTGKEQLQVHYSVDNQGAMPMMVFDRGNVHAILTKQQSVGAVGQPLFRMQGRDLTLLHLARALPDPTPISPPTPVAARVPQGERLQGRFTFDLTLADAPQRVRWCLGVAAFNDNDFQQARDGNGVDLWTASFALADTQQQLCTPWFDLQAGRFEDTAS